MQRPEELSQQNVLYGCLDWGSGHVARSIPLLRQLISQKNSIFLWCTSEQEAIFRMYGIEAVFIARKGFLFRFKGDGNFTKEMSRNALRFSKSIKSDRKEVDYLVKKFNISMVVSDHCYGLVSNAIPSIFVTHQVQLPPKAGWLARYVHRRWLKPFSSIWIMDDETKPLAGELSRSNEKSIYIGWYSRFQHEEITTVPGKVVGIVSGPEPYSEQMFQWILGNYGKENLILISNRAYSKVSENVTLISDWKQGDQEIASAETIVSRNGYSTLMDLQFLKKKAILIPTPGQLEQEYLHENSNLFNRNSSGRN